MRVERGESQPKPYMVYQGANIVRYLEAMHRRGSEQERSASFAAVDMLNTYLAQTHRRLRAQAGIPHPLVLDFDTQQSQGQSIDISEEQKESLYKNLTLLCADSMFLIIGGLQEEFDGGLWRVANLVEQCDSDVRSILGTAQRSIIAAVNLLPRQKRSVAYDRWFSITVPDLPLGKTSSYAHLRWSAWHELTHFHREDARKANELHAAFWNRGKRKPSQAEKALFRKRMRWMGLYVEGMASLSESILSGGYPHTDAYYLGYILGTQTAQSQFLTLHPNELVVQLPRTAKVGEYYVMPSLFSFLVQTLTVSCRDLSTAADTMWHADHFELPDFFTKLGVNYEPVVSQWQSYLRDTWKRQDIVASHETNH